MSYRKTYNRPALLWQKQREIAFYKALEGIPHFPNLIAVDDIAIYITHCGELLVDQIEQVNISDIKGQMSVILDTLEKAGIRHRDITANNLCWKGGTLYLVDFGWSIWSTEEDSPEPVPEVMRGWMCNLTDRQQAHATMLKLAEVKDDST